MKAAKQFNARRQPRSGAGNYSDEKEDLVSDHFLFQHKETIKTRSHTIKHIDLVELKRNAIDAGKNPVYIVSFSGDMWCMIPKSHFDILREESECL